MYYYHCRGDLCWKVEDLWELSKDLIPFYREVDLFTHDLNTDHWFSYIQNGKNIHITPTLNLLLEEIKRVNTCDLNYPIILCPEYKIMDGVHRLAKSILTGQKLIKCVRFTELP